MAAPKICMGCFSEWNIEEHCPYCGWDPRKPLERIEGVWTVGDVIAGRYLFGTILCTTEDMAVWRVYDNDLGIVCYFIRKMKATEEDLQTLARSLEAINQKTSGFLVVLGIKVVARRRFLVISVQERHIKEESFLALLQNDPVDQEKLITEVICDFDNHYQERTLPEYSLLDGRYQVIACIGVGGFGITYLCVDLFLHRNVAIKEYFPVEWVEREGMEVAVCSSRYLEPYRIGLQSFYQEAKMTASFIHTSHIVTIYDIFSENDTAYMVLDYLSGISIGREMRVRAYRPYYPEEMAKIILPVLEPLAEIHDKKMVHSDISPGNIMKSQEGDICLIDMGAAKYCMDRQPLLSTAFLKKDYAAPEQYRTARTGIPENEGPWTDIYGVGAIMYYLLTGHKPTDALSRLQGKSTDLVPPKKYKVKLSKYWMRLIQYCMELDWTKRPGSVREVSERIRQLL